MSTVSIVIPTLNRQDLVTRCLDSVAQQTHTDLQVIVVDDGSTEAIDTGGRAKIVRMKKNSGFAKATNAGIREATGDWLLMLNNDVTMEPDCIERMLARAEETNAAMIAPLLLWDDQRDTIYSAGDRMRQDCRPEPIGFRAPLEGFEFPDFIFGVTGACGLFRRDLLETVGFLDEHFGAYFEDAHLCFRARLKGFEAALAGDAVAYHIGSASQDGQTWYRSAQCWRNHALLVARCMPEPLRKKYARVLREEREHQWRRLWSSARADLGTWRAIGVALRYKKYLSDELPNAEGMGDALRRSATVTPEQVDAWLTKPE